MLFQLEILGALEDLFWLIEELFSSTEDLLYLIGVNLFYPPEFSIPATNIALEYEKKWAETNIKIPVLPLIIKESS
jgi:hypothetical protein